MNDEPDELDLLLRDADSAAPADFSARVMRRIAALPLPRRRPRRWRLLAQRLALVAAAALGANQVLAFIFGLWAATAAAAA